VLDKFLDHFVNIWYFQVLYFVVREHDSSRREKVIHIKSDNMAVHMN